MSDSIYHALRQAVLDQTPVQLIYKGLHRETCPHVIGLKNGREQFLGYQIGGESSSRPLGPIGSPNNWRCMTVEESSNVVARPDLTWGTSPRHTQPQNCVDIVDAEVDY